MKCFRCNFITIKGRTEKKCGRVATIEENGRLYCHKHADQINRGDWYQKNVEAPLRGLTRLFRNNGINTECSCGHVDKKQGYIQIQYLGEEIWELHKLLCNNGYHNYTIKPFFDVREGHINSSMNVYISMDELMELSFEDNEW